MTHLELFNTRTVEQTLDQLSKYWAEVKQLEYFNARSIEEAVSLLDKYAEKAKIIAGGVDLVRLMRNKIIDPRVLVNIDTIPDLASITKDAECLKIGALTTINDIHTSVVVREKYPLLAEAAFSVSSPQVRQMATIGGNLCQEVNCWYYRMSPVTGKTFFCYRKGGTQCFAAHGDNRYHSIFPADTCHAVCQSDMAPALIALEAEMTVASPGGERVIPLEALYTPLGVVLKPNELITDLRIPNITHDTKQRYLKFRIRKTIDPAIASVAVVLTASEGRVERARIMLGGVAPVPYRSVRAEDVLIGKKVTESLAQTAAEAAVSTALPLSMNAYKVSIIKALVKRAILGQNS